MGQRRATDGKLIQIDYVCATPEHIAAGKKVADGQGTVSVNGRRWAYCPAGLTDAPHDWQETGGIALESIHHGDLLTGPPTS